MLPLDNEPSTPRTRYHLWVWWFSILGKEAGESYGANVAEISAKSIHSGAPFLCHVSGLAHSRYTCHAGNTAWPITFDDGAAEMLCPGPSTSANATSGVEHTLFPAMQLWPLSHRALQQHMLAGDDAGTSPDATTLPTTAIPLRSAGIQQESLFQKKPGFSARLRPSLDPLPPYFLQHRQLQLHHVLDSVQIFRLAWALAAEVPRRCCCGLFHSCILMNPRSCCKLARSILA